MMIFACLMISRMLPEPDRVGKMLINNHILQDGIIRKFIVLARMKGNHAKAPSGKKRPDSPYPEVWRVSWWCVQEPADTCQDTPWLKEECQGSWHLGRSQRQWLGPASQAEVRSWFWRPQLQSYGCYQEKDEEEAPKRPFPDKKAYMAYK